MIKLESIDESSTSAPGSVVVIYGKGGNGKTTFAANNQLKQLFVIVDDDGGIKSLRKLPEEIKSTIDVQKLVVPEGASPIGMLAKLISELKPSLNQYHSIVFDPLSEIRDRQAAFISKTEMGGQQLQIKQWGELAKQLDRLLMEIISLRELTNVVICTHEESKTLEDSITQTSTVIIQTTLGDKANRKLEKYADEILRIQKNGDVVSLDFGLSTNTITKSRKFGHEPKENLLKTNISLVEVLY